jgi:hypothetical protein
MCAGPRCAPDQKVDFSKPFRRFIRRVPHFSVLLLEVEFRGPMPLTLPGCMRGKTALALWQMNDLRSQMQPPLRRAALLNQFEKGASK